MRLAQKIDSERIVLEHPARPTFKLAEKLYEVVDKSRDTLREWFPWVDKTNSAEDEYNYYLVGVCQKKWENKSAFGYLIYQKKTRKILGNINLCSVDEKNHSAEIGYWLAKDAVGYGYMQEAIRALEKVAFSVGINRIVIKNDVKNLRSTRVAERSGYIFEGIMRQDAWDECHNCFRNTNIWSKLKSEWKKNK